MVGMENVAIRRAVLADVPRILRLEEACYPTLSTVSRWRPELLESHQRRFPEGQFVAAAGDDLVGHSASFVTRSALVLRPHTFRDATARGTFDTHDPRGDVLYGAEIMVHPAHRRRGVGKRLYRARLDLARTLGLRYFAAGGRIPGYVRHAASMSAEEYVRAVVEGRLTDRVLSAQLRSGLRVLAVLPGYLNDPKSGGYATLLAWENPDLAPRGGPGAPSPRAT